MIWGYHYFWKHPYTTKYKPGWIDLFKKNGLVKVHKFVCGVLERSLCLPTCAFMKPNHLDMNDFAYPWKIPLARITQQFRWICCWWDPDKKPLNIPLTRFEQQLGGGFKHFLFSPLPGKMIQFDEHIFQLGWNHQLDDFSSKNVTIRFTPSHLHGDFTFPSPPGRPSTPGPGAYFNHENRRMWQSFVEKPSLKGS